MKWGDNKGYLPPRGLPGRHARSIHPWVRGIELPTLVLDARNEWMTGRLLEFFR